MSLLAAYAFGNMTVQVGEIYKEPPGLTQFSDSGSTIRPGVANGVIQRRIANDSLNGAAYLRFPLLRRSEGLKLSTEGRFIYIGYRIKNFVADSNIRPYQLIVPNSVGTGIVVDPGYVFTTLVGVSVGQNIKEAFIEIRIDLQTGWVAVWVDGTLMDNRNLSLLQYVPYIDQYGWMGFNLPTREYSGSSKTADNMTSIRDIYVVQSDDVYPNERLGPVVISDVPVVVDSVSGFDKDSVDMQSIANQSLTAGPSTSFTASAQVAKLNEMSGEIGFRLDLDPAKADRFIGAAVRVGAKRSGTTPIATKVEVGRYGQTIDRNSVALPNNGSERMHFGTPVSHKDSPTETGTSVIDLTYKLKVTGA